MAYRLQSLAGYYELPKEVWSHSRPNQPPGSILLHLYSQYIYRYADGLIALLNTKFLSFPSALVWFWQDHGELISIKIFSILADFAIALLLYKAGGKGIALIYLVNPPMWYSSSFWGQTDSVVAAFALWSVYFLIKGRLARSSLLLGMTLITKASWAPMALFYLIYFLKTHFRKIHNLLFGGLVVIFVSWPFYPSLDIVWWLGNLFLTRILPGETALATVGAFNLHQLIWGQMVDHWFSAVLALLILVPLCLYMAFDLIRKSNPRKFVYCLVVLFWSFFLFNTKMHERYLYPVFSLLSYLLVLRPSVKLMVVYAIISLTFMFNLYYMWFAPGISWLVGFYTSGVMNFVSLLNIILFIVFFGLKSSYVKD
jgi:Gpi18-like mannosyltransferase